MDRPPAKDGTSETVEEGDDDIWRIASRRSKQEGRGFGVGKFSLLVEDVWNLGCEHRFAKRVFREAGRSPSGAL